MHHTTPLAPVPPRPRRRSAAWPAWALGAGLVLVRPPDITAEPAGPRWQLGASAAVWQPRRDARDVAETSAGVRPHVGFALHPAIALTADFDWVFVERNPDLVAGDVYYYAVSVGARFTTPWRSRVKPFADLTAGRYSVHADCDPRDCGGAVVHDDGLGFRVGAGATIAITPRLIGTAGLGYSHARLDLGSFIVDESDLDALVFDVGLGTRL